MAQYRHVNYQQSNPVNHASATVVLRTNQQHDIKT